MDTPELKYMLSISPAASLVINRALDVLACNAAAEQCGFSDGGSLLKSEGFTAAKLEEIKQLFSSTAKRRFHLDRGADDLNLSGVGWRLGGVLRAKNLVMLQCHKTRDLNSHFKAMTQAYKNERHARALDWKNAALSQANEQLRMVAETDHMTGLLNARSFRSAMNLRVSIGQPFGLIYLDLNGLKFINDTYGHRFGDTAIKEMATTIKANIRDSDIAARLGGDEFAILVTGRLSGVGLRALATRISKGLNVRGHGLPERGPIDYSTAMGAAIWPQDASTAEGLEDCADKAMYQSKQRRDGIVFAQELKKTPNLRIVS